MAKPTIRGQVHINKPDDGYEVSENTVAIRNIQYYDFDEDSDEQLYWHIFTGANFDNPANPIFNIGIIEGSVHPRPRKSDCPPTMTYAGTYDHKPSTEEINLHVPDAFKEN